MRRTRASSSEQLGGVARRGCARVELVRQPGLAHALDRVVDAHVERVVAAEQHPVGAGRLDEGTERARGRARASRTAAGAGTTTAACAHPCASGRTCHAWSERPMRTSAGSRRRARRRVLQIRMPVEHAREDEVRQRDGVLDRLAHGVREVEAVEPLVEAAAERVQEHDRAELRGARPERLEPLVRELDVAGERRDLDAGEPAADHGVLERTRRSSCGCCSGTSPRPSSRSGAPATCSAMARFASLAAHDGELLGRPRVVVRSATATRPARRRPAGPSRRGARRAR